MQWNNRTSREKAADRGRFSIMPAARTRGRPASWWVLLPLLALLGSVPAAAQTIIAIEDDIITDTTWDSGTADVYLVTESITVISGVILTIQPGTVIKFAPARRLTVQGILNAVGLAAAGSHIQFTSSLDENIGVDVDEGELTVPNPSSWDGILFEGSESSGSVLSYCEIWFGGGDDGALVRCEGASPSLDHCDLHAGRYGIACAGGAAPVISETTINACTSVPVVIGFDADPTFDAVVFGSEQDNGYDGIGLPETNLLADARLPIRSTRIGAVPVENVTYVLLGRVQVGEGVVLRLQPGVVIKAAAAAAGFMVQGRLEAQGTADSSIVFTSVRDDAWGTPYDTNRDETATSPASGDWGGFLFQDGSTGLLECCTVRFGNSSSLIEAESGADLTVRSCLLEYGVTGLLAAGGAQVSLVDNVVRGCTGTPLTISAATALTQSGNTFAANGITAMGLLPGLLKAGHLQRLDLGGFAGLGYYLSSTLQVDSLLTVDPGVTIKFAPGCEGLVIRGTLSAVGTVDQPIVFTSLHDDCSGNPADAASDGWTAGPCPGDWGGLTFARMSHDCILHYCVFLFGGRDCRGVVMHEGPEPDINSCVLEWNLVGFESRVLYTGDFKMADEPEPTSLLRPGGPLSQFVTSNTTVHNVIPGLVRLGGTVPRDAVLQPASWGAGMSTIYLLVEDLIVPYDVTLTIEPGVSFMARGTGVIVRGALIADVPPDEDIITGVPADFDLDLHGGTGGSPITPGGCTFVPGCDLSALDPRDCLFAKSGAGDSWKGFTFEGTNDDAVSLMRGVTIQHAISAVTVISAAPLLEDLKILNAVEAGIRVEGRARPVIRDCLVQDCGGPPVAISLMADPQLSGNRFLENAYDGIGVLGETVARDFSWGPRDVAQRRNLPYVVLEDLTVGPGVNLTLEPGLRLKFLPEVRLDVQHGLLARGGASPESVIVFTSIADDQFGGDTNNDGNLSGGSDNGWGGLHLEGTTVLGEIELRHCIFRFAGGQAEVGALNLYRRAAPWIEDCTFAHNGIGVVFHDASGDPAVGGLRNCDLMGNTEQAVLNLGLVQVVSAEECWWGDATGPFDPSDDTGTGGLFNPGGLGDAVSDRVDYAPWRTDGPHAALLGDVSLSGDVTALDAALVLAHLVGETTLTPWQQTLGDVTCIEGLTALDAAYILRFVAGFDACFPCEAESVTTKDEPAGGLQLAALDYAIDVSRLPPGAPDRERVAVSWAGSGEALAAELVLRAARGLRFLSARGADQARLATRIDDDGLLHLALASASPLASGTLAELELEATGAAPPGSATAPVTVLAARINEQTVAGTPSPGGSLPPSAFVVEQNRPNPFNPTTLIRFVLPGGAGEAIPTQVDVYDLTGRRIRTLAHDDLSPGTHSLVWDGRDDAGSQVASGIYVYCVRTDRFSCSRKMTLLK